MTILSAFFWQICYIDAYIKLTFIMKTILIAVDFSSETDRIIEQGAKLARKDGAKLWLIHVAAPDPVFVGYSVGPDYVIEDRADKLRLEHRKLQTYSAKLKDKGIDADSLLIQGNAVELILEKADELKADMLVIGSHGHGMLYDALIGSVCTGVLRKCKIPMLIVPVRKK